MALDRIGTADAPRQLFASTPAQRVALARQQFFEEGVRPSGLVGEAVIQRKAAWPTVHGTPPGRERSPALPHPPRPPRPSSTSSAR